MDRCAASPADQGFPDDHVPTSENVTLALLERARNGDRDALDRLCARYLPLMRRWAAGRLPRYARGLHDTEDLVQETLIKTLRNLGHFEMRHEGALRAYLREALDNGIRHVVRGAHRKPPAASLGSVEFEDPADSPLQEAVGREQLEAYERALQALSAQDREVIVGRLELGMEYDDLAVAVGKPSAGAARMASGRAMLRLARAMARE